MKRTREDISSSSAKYDNSSQPKRDFPQEKQSSWKKEKNENQFQEKNNKKVQFQEDPEAPAQKKRKSEKYQQNEQVIDKEAPISFIVAPDTTNADFFFEFDISGFLSFLEKTNKSSKISSNISLGNQTIRVLNKDLNSFEKLQSILFLLRLCFFPKSKLSTPAKSSAPSAIPTWSNFLLVLKSLKTVHELAVFLSFLEKNKIPNPYSMRLLWEHFSMVAKDNFVKYQNEKKYCLGQLTKYFKQWVTFSLHFSLKYFTDIMEIMLETNLPNFSLQKDCIQIFFYILEHNILPAEKRDQKFEIKATLQLQNKHIENVEEENHEEMDVEQVNDNTIAQDQPIGKSLLADEEIGKFVDENIDEANNTLETEANTPQAAKRAAPTQKKNWWKCQVSEYSGLLMLETTKKIILDLIQKRKLKILRFFFQKYINLVKTPREREVILIWIISFLITNAPTDSEENEQTFIAEAKKYNKILKEKLKLPEDSRTLLNDIQIDLKESNVEAAEAKFLKLKDISTEKSGNLPDAHKFSISIHLINEFLEFYLKKRKFDKFYAMFCNVLEFKIPQNYKTSSLIKRFFEIFGGTDEFTSALANFTKIGLSPVVLQIAKNGGQMSNISLEKSDNSMQQKIKNLFFQSILNSEEENLDPFDLLDNFLQMLEDEKEIVQDAENESSSTNYGLYLHSIIKRIHNYHFVHYVFGESQELIEKKLKTIKKIMHMFCGPEEDQKVKKNVFLKKHLVTKTIMLLCMRSTSMKHLQKGFALLEVLKNNKFLNEDLWHGVLYSILLQINERKRFNPTKESENVQDFLLEKVRFVFKEYLAAKREEVAQKIAKEKEAEEEKLKKEKQEKEEKLLLEKQAEERKQLKRNKDAAPLPNAIVIPPKKKEQEPEEKADEKKDPYRRYDPEKIFRKAAMLERTLVLLFDFLSSSKESKTPQNPIENIKNFINFLEENQFQCKTMLYNKFLQALCDALPSPQKKEILDYQAQILKSLFDRSYPNESTFAVLFTTYFKNFKICGELFDPTKFFTLFIEQQRMKSVKSEGNSSANLLLESVQRIQFNLTTLTKGIHQLLDTGAHQFALEFFDIATRTADEAGFGMLLPDQTCLELIQRCQTEKKE